MQIRDNVFVVTGAGSGLGAATAKMIVARGGKVVLADVNLEAGEAIAAQLERQGSFCSGHGNGAAQGTRQLRRRCSR
jgi:NADP-dependent 3-hydroxy acid dehydrogenase YdfG